MDIMTINNEEWVKLSSIPKLPAGDQLDWSLGKSYHIETVTKYFTGVLIGITEDSFLLEKAAWIASTGDFSDYVKGSLPRECEPYDPKSILRIARGAYVSAIERKLVLELIR